MFPIVVTGLFLMKKRGMMEVFSPPIRKFWKEYQLRAMAVISLLLQIILIYNGKRRRHVTGRTIRFVVWSAYLLADAVATIALGILSNDLGNIFDSGGKLDSKHEITALWAPFFLLHLGGPDTITAYSLEDNELYLRHLFGLLVQTIVTGYILLMAWTNSTLSFLGLPMIIVGSIKYGERSWALWKASRDELHDSMLSFPDQGPNYAKLMDEYSLRNAEGYSVVVVLNKDQDEPGIAEAVEASPKKNLIKAHEMFKIFKRLFADLILSYREQENSQSLIKGMTCEDAFDMIAIELGFMYDLLYTKATVIYTANGVFRRISTFLLTCAVLVIFSLDDLVKYDSVDVVITFLLLAGAIFLEIYAAIKLIHSDQTKCWRIQNKNTKLILPIKLLELRKITQLLLSAIKRLKLHKLSRWSCCQKKEKLPRWSARMGQYCLLSLFLNEKPLFKLLQKHSCRLLENNLFRLLERHGYRSEVAVDDDMRGVIFKYVTDKYKEWEKKRENSSYFRELCSQRGNCALEEYKKKVSLPLNLGWSVNCEFDESILIWHIATEICSYTEKPVDDETRPHFTMSRLISRYIVYLLAVYPFMLPSGIGLIRLRDTRAEAEKFFEERLSTSDAEESNSNTAAASNADKKKTSSGHDIDPYDQSRTEACKTLGQVKIHVLPLNVKGDRSKSVLFDACRLAAELNKIDEKKVKWELIRDVWLEMLTFAAKQCRGTEHAQQLRRGGELLTHVWLLLAHFGMIEQFQISKGNTRAWLRTK